MENLPCSKIIGSWKLWDMFCIKWNKNPKINLEEQMKVAKAHLNELMMNNISVPDFMEPTLYP